MNQRIGTLVVGATLLVPSVAGASHSVPETVGVSMFFQDGAAPVMDIIGDDLRYIDEIDIVATVNTGDDQGMDPVINNSDMSGLDWSGLQMVEEDWRPDGMGTFTRQRFYRGAKWMEKRSWFVVYQANGNGLVPAIPFIIGVGSDNFWSFFDGGFVRRFGARQITRGCAAIGDCSWSVSYTAEGLAQFRHTLRPLLNSRDIHPDTTKFVVQWTADPGNLREVQIAQVDEATAPFSQGFNPEVVELSTPPNGQFYSPGDDVTFGIRFIDDDGNVIAGDGDMPTYSEFLFGIDNSGLRYFDINLQTTLFYALKHRESNMILAMSGPAQNLDVPKGVVNSFLFFGPTQVQTTSVVEDGWTGLAYLIPNFGVIFGGFADPTIWDTPVPDQYTFTIPQDADPGTYVVSLKARRDYGGEALNRGDVVRVQVGTTQVTQWKPTTGPCNTCHRGESAIGEILHGIEDRESCFGCHASLDIEPDARLDYRIHFIHSRSERYPGDVNDCSTCHFEQPEGDPIGFPGFVYPFE